MMFWQKKWNVIFFFLAALPYFILAAASDSNDVQKMDAIERKKHEPRISNKWFLGSYLIYDCIRGSFICVNSQSFEYCKKERKKDQKNANASFRCAPFRMFKSQRECFKEQYRQIENQKPKVYCINPKYY